jgi:hypothetical protein
MPGLKFEIEQSADLASGQFQLLQHATAEMQLSGPNAAMSGTDPRELSGRAILAQQAGGAAQNEPLADALRYWSRRVYESCWMAAREYWSGGKWVRLTDELNGTTWVGINRPIRAMDRLAAMPEQMRMQMMQRMQLQPDDPRLQQVVGIENDITDLDVDITIEEGIDIPSLQQEQFATLVQLAGMQPGLIPGDVLIAASGLQDKEQLLQRMQAHQQQQGQVQQQAGQLAQQHAQADIQSKQAKAASDFALAQERKVNAASKVHDIHADFSAPPYGQPNVAPDNPPGVQGMQPSDPEQMTSEMALAHHLVDLHKKAADIRNTQAQAALTAAKAAQIPHQTVGEIANTHQTMVTTNRLAQTPIPQPAAPTAP